MKQRHWSLTPSCQVSYESDVPCVLMVWQGYLTSAQFRDANERVLEMLQKARCSKLLGDITDFTLIGAEDQAWLNHDWIPRAIEAGLRTSALVQPVYYFNQVAVDNVTQHIDRNRLSVVYFPDRDSARNYLRGLS